MIEPKEFEKRFSDWVDAVCQKVDGDIISVDGKTLRRSGASGQKPIHMVSAWSNKQQLVLGQIATEEKSNEITAVPELLEILDVAGCIITADAMSCQKAITQKVTEKGADYVLGLKDNHPLFRREVEEYFAAAMKDPKNYPDVKTQKTTDFGHGRIEYRTYHFTTETDWYEGKAEWSNLRSFGMVLSKVEYPDKTTEDVRFFISSLEDISAFSQAVRKHWGIENSLHWCLDMTFHEDYSRIRKDHTAENMAVVRHISLNMLKNHPAKISIARKRRRCSYDGAFLAEVILCFHA